MPGTPTTNIAPWLSVRSTVKAIAFYRAAFGAVEAHHVEDPDGNAVSRLSVHGAEFWVADAPEQRGAGAEQVGRGTVRIILTVPDPDAVYASALAAGAIQVHPISEDHGWRVGRLVDPFGMHWEIGRPLR